MWFDMTEVVAQKLQKHDVIYQTSVKHLHDALKIQPLWSEFSDQFAQI